ncbi:MAG: FAD-dependent oxidoreductase [Mesorhizobium sp.]|nr:FAD-dependent oxidoreductase [Mesorhizobium sp.]
MNFDIVIVGSGQAGFQTAVSLRQEGFEGSIAIIGEEPGLPYQRPPLSKAYLKEGVADRLRFRDAGFFETNRIKLEDGSRVAEINRHDKTVKLEDGRRLGYGHLVLATGARNRRLPIDGIDLDGVVDLRTLGHADSLRQILASTRRLAVIGGGFIGLEIAATARAMGAEVTVLEATDRLMSRVVSPPVSAHFLAAHREAGIDVRLDTMASGITGSNGKATGVKLQDGSTIAADLVLVAAGVVANGELAEAAGLYVHDGIRVDDMLATEDPDISALGDCASFPFGHDGMPTRLESVQNAVDQAKCLAKRLTGKEERYAALPWFWSDQGPHKLQIAGLAVGADHHEQFSGGEGKLTVLCFRRGELIGVETVNAPADHMAARKLLSSDQPVTLEDAKAAGFDVAALFRSRKG